MARPWIDEESMRIVRLEAADKDESIKDAFKRLIRAGASPAILKRVEEEGNAIKRTIGEWEKKNPSTILKWDEEEEKAIKRPIGEWEKDVRED